MRQPCPTPRYPVALPGQHPRPPVGALGRARPSGDPRRHPRRRARPAGRRRLRPGLVPRRLADRRGRAAGLARRIPSGWRSTTASCRTSARPTSAARASRSATITCTSDFGGDDGARPAARAPAGARAAAHPRLRPEPHGAGPPLGDRAPGLLRLAGRRSSSRRSPRTTGASRRTRAPHPGLRPRPVLRRLARHAAAELRQPGAAGGHARRAPPDRAPVRRRALRHGDAGPAGGVREDLGDLRGPVLAAGHGGRPRQGPGLPLPRRGLLGPRVDAPAAGLRLHLRQAALRPPRATATRARCASTSTPGSTSRTAWPASSRTTTSRAPPRRSRPNASAPAAIVTFLTPGPALLPPGPARGQAGAHPGAPRAGTGRGPGRGIAAFYDRLARLPEGPGVPRRRAGSSSTCRPAWDGNGTWDCFVAFAWTGPDEQRRLVAVNYADHQSQCYVALPWGDLDGRTWRLRGPDRAVRLRPRRARPRRQGLYLDMPAWGYHVFAVSPAE